MAGAKNLFAPVPLRAMAMDLSGLQLRVLICVAAHDRMSIVTCKGQGCRASNERMRKLINCSYQKLCEALTKLVDLGLLERGKQGRLTVYRVVYTDEDRSLFGDTSGRSTCHRSSGDDGVTRHRHTSRSGENPTKSGNNIFRETGRRHSVETGENSSFETARHSARSDAKKEFSENVGGQMAALERAMKSGQPIDRLDWAQRLHEIAMGSGDQADVGRAIRLTEELVELMVPDEFQAWAEERRQVDETGC